LQSEKAPETLTQTSNDTPTAIFLLVIQTDI
jgi:hypothetical protein